MRRKKPTNAELEEMTERHARVLANAERTRALARAAQAKARHAARRAARSPRPPTKLTKPEREAERARVLANAEHNRKLAVRAQAMLDAQRSASRTPDWASVRECL